MDGPGGDPGVALRPRHRLSYPALLLVACATIGASADRGSIERSERLPVDGAALYLETRGEDRSAPVVLWLHGGPGGAERPLFRHFNGGLEERFVVVYWDQRGAGRSFDPAADPALLTIDRHLRDLDAVVEHLRGSLGCETIALIGHSWGSALGLLYARAHPDKVAGFIGVAQIVSPRAAQQAEAEFVRREASRRADHDTLERLDEIGPPPHESAEQVLAMERLVERYGGLFHEPPSRIWAVVRGVFGGFVTPWEIPRFIRGNDVSLAAMNHELLALDLARSVPKVDVPVYFFLGRFDRHADSTLAARYLDALEAPSKGLIWFEGSAHNPPFEEPEAFDAAVVRALDSMGSGTARR